LAPTRDSPFSSVTIPFMAAVVTPCAYNFVVLIVKMIRKLVKKEKHLNNK
jgi:hypothetical protein